MSRFTQRIARGKSTQTTSEVGDITHGEDLMVSDVGPWALQSVSRGSETLQAMTTPSRGYWRVDTSSEFVPSQIYTYDNNPSNHGGIVPTGGLTIDGYFVPAGTAVCQFRSFSDGFYAQSVTAKLLFRGCSWRTTNIDGSSIINDAYSVAGNWQCFMHYCDMGAPSKETDGGAFWKMIGGSNHRAYRTYISDVGCGIQPNVNGVEITEVFIDGILFLYGEMGTSGVGPDSTTGHVNGISLEGNIQDLTIQRCKIIIPSPDGATGSGGSDPGNPGYGTQPGQLGYGSGTNPGRIVGQTDCIALFTNQGVNTNILIADNYLGGTGYCFYGSDSGAGATTNNVFTGNKFSTKWWTNGGQYGPYTGSIVFGSNGNVNSNNTWADDYGSGGNGCTALFDRQYPLGNGPRVGTTAF